MKLSYPSNKICPCCGTGGYVWYMADSEYVAKCTNCGHYFHKEDFPMCVLDSVPKPKTNAERIRAMTDEALAEWLKSIRYSWTCVPRNNGNRCADFKDDCNACWLDWLKKEVE